jgi:hypothetical protein
VRARVDSTPAASISHGDCSEQGSPRTFPEVLRTPTISRVAASMTGEPEMPVAVRHSGVRRSERTTAPAAGALRAMVRGSTPVWVLTSA